MLFYVLINIKIFLIYFKSLGINFSYFVLVINRRKSLIGSRFACCVTCSNLVKFVKLPIHNDYQVVVKFYFIF